MKWVEEELKESDLKDKRRTKRLIRIVEDLSAQPNKSVPEASRDQAALQGMYDFWSNPRIKAQDILSGHQKSTLERIAQHQTVLAIQDRMRTGLQQPSENQWNWANQQPQSARNQSS